MHVTVPANLHDNTLHTIMQRLAVLPLGVVCKKFRRSLDANTVHICRTEAVARQLAGDDASATDWAGLSCMQAVMCCF